MKKSNLILASVLAIIFTSILIIFSPTSQKTSLSSPTPIPISTESISLTPDPTADWKTYENKEYGFSFKYPQELGLKIQSIDRDDDEVQLFNSDNNQLINIEYLPNFSCPIDSCKLLTPITFNKTTFVPIETEIGQQSYIVHDIYRIWVNTDDDKNNISPQILSTFKFTNTKTNSNNYDGCYTSKNALIKIETTATGSTVLHGNATWENGYATGDDRFTVHEGTIDGILDISDNTAHFYKDGCDIDFEFNQNIMVAKERKGSVCGGINVTFDGEYNLSNIDSPSCSTF